MYRELWQRKLPGGLLSWRYLLPAPDERIRIHRLLWWRSHPNWPLVLRLIIDAWAWLRWVLFSGWRACWRSWRLHSKTVVVRHGISDWRQARILLALSMGSCIPPRDVYRYRLFQDPDRAWSYIYDQETSAYHLWRSRPLGPGKASHALLSDKKALGELLTAHTIPMVRNLACVSQGDFKILWSYTEDGSRLFCKTRRGNRGIGAFTVWRRGSVIRGRGFDGKELTDRGAVERAWQFLQSLDDVLIQPCLENHPDLAPLAVGDDAITVRYISRIMREAAVGLSATLEIPAGTHPRHHQPTYVILPVGLDDGRIQPWPEDLLWNRETYRKYDAVMSNLPAGKIVPHWRQLVADSHKAHTHFQDIWAIAWDWVVTPQGARLLEGNSGWGTSTPQMLSGGFLDGELNSRADTDTSPGSG